LRSRRGESQAFSKDAEGTLLDRALTIFNYRHPGTVFSDLAVYHSEDAEDSDVIADFAATDVGNPLAVFFRKSFLPEVARELPRIVGISVSGSFQLSAAFTLARLIKEVDSRICVVIGGAFFSTVPEMLLAPKTSSNLFRHVDAFVFNEGERPFASFIRKVMSGSLSRTGLNVLEQGQPELSYYPRSCLRPDQVATPLFPVDVFSKYFRTVPMMPVEVSRGCYWGKCAFCNLSVGANGRYRGFPVGNIFRDLKLLMSRHGLRNVIFSTLAMAPNILRGVAAGLLEAGMEISWSAWVRPEKTLTERDIDLFKKAGCSSLSVTPESFSKRTLARMRKGFDVPSTIRIIRHLADLGLCGAVNIIPGFPGETMEDFWETIETCRELGLRGEFFPFHLLKNSPIYREAKQFGLVTHEDPKKDLAVAVPFTFANSASESTGVQLIRRAARRYPLNIYADDPMAGYTFDFSFPTDPARAIG
jgi:radical SAM superfamily enzyme YgiQ (UPF0313 family)